MDGSAPMAGLIRGSGTDSNFYGTTEYGGTNDAGTVYQVTRTGTLTILHSFTGGSGGANPAARLMQAADGNFYGTTINGPNGSGVVFRVSSNGSFAVVSPCPNNGYLASDLAQTTNGSLLGTTTYGGTGIQGCLYRVNPIGPATYTWSINNGTIVAGQGTPYITWNAGSPGIATISVTITNTIPCTTTITNTVTVFAYSPIAAGGVHSVALRPDGTLWTWGYNGDGELSDGVNDGLEKDRPYPGEVADPTSCTGQFITNPVAVAAGGNEFTIVADANGAVWASGGEPNTCDYGTDRYPATPVSGVSNVVSVAAGYGHVLALCTNGSVWAWGSDGVTDQSGENIITYGQLGDGGAASSNYCAVASSPIPALIPTGTVIVAIAAGQYHSVALDANGNVWTFGYNGYGQLGNGGTNSVFTPAMLTTISNVIAVAAGDYHTLAVTADKRLWTWGGNGSGQLGNGSRTNVLTPAPLLMSNVVAIAAGNQFTLAVTNGHVYAWGDNSYGQLGANPSNVGSISSPMLVAGVSNVVRVSASLELGNPGGPHSLAMTVDQGTNHYWAWGYNYDGEVGNGTNSGNYSGASYNQYSPAQLQFCTRCQRCVQLGTGGVFTAQCTGTLYLYFNGEIGSGNYSGMYTATVNGVTNPVPVTSVQFLENGGPGNGVSFGTVTNGGVYPYSATGYCAYNGAVYQADPNGIDPNTHQYVGCDPSPENNYFNKTNSVCPSWQCFSLVGKIQ